MRSAGRPLRFMKLLLGGWIGLRAVALLAPTVWSIAQPDAPPRQMGLRSARKTKLMKQAEPAPGPDIARSDAGPGKGAGAAPAIFGGPVIAGSGQDGDMADMLLGGASGFAEPGTAGGLVERIGRIVAKGEGQGNPAAPGAGARLTPRAGGERRWSGAAWLLWRPEVGNGFSRAPLLGGSQAGARIDYRLAGGGGRGELTVYGRASRAFVGPASEEAALGLAWRPGRLPISFLAERRQALGTGGRNGFALLAAGGTGPRDIAPAIEMESYVQAGIVGLREGDGFADGKMNLGYRLTAPGEARRVTLGASLSGSVQPGASRLDIGPELKLRLPIRGAAMRFSAEWRMRIAGDARPDSGPAVTLVTQF